MADTSEQQNQQITQAVADTGAFSAFNKFTIYLFIIKIVHEVQIKEKK